MGAKKKKYHVGGGLGWETKFFYTISVLSLLNKTEENKKWKYLISLKVAVFSWIMISLWLFKFQI